MMPQILFSEKTPHCLVTLCTSNGLPMHAQKAFYYLASTIYYFLIIIKESVIINNNNKTSSTIY